MAFQPGDRLIYTHPNGVEEECEMVSRPELPARVVVRFFNEDGTTRDAVIRVNFLRYKG
jgi:hypothetical protein